MRGPHEYNPECQCYKCKGIRNNPQVNHHRPKHRQSKPRHASREEQHARYLDSGPSAWDDRG